MPKISVIIPVYNTEKYLERCLDSIVAQTMEDIEILIVNDGSEDDSERIILAYRDRYPDRIRYLSKENGGLSSARNLGMEHATGEFLAFIDSDDFATADMLAMLYAAAKEQKKDIAECDFDWIWPDRTATDTAETYTDAEDSFLRGRVMACNKIYRRGVVARHGVRFPEGLQYEDIEFFYKLLPHINGIASVHRVGYGYVQRADSIVNRQTERTRDIFAILSRVFAYYRENEFFGACELYETGIEYLYIRFLLGSSFLRMVQIPDKKLRRDCLRESLELLNATFPNWRRNALLNARNTGKHRYFKTVGRYTLGLYARLLRLKGRT
jgi:glycosyltransferase involved in cell wall biosynthesis